ncbi:MAG: hypothetical protein KDA83_13310 [Planctomycetales bacterium]|nr:hypothetical protein [Planctomycetales bacterium]
MSIEGHIFLGSMILASFVAFLGIALSRRSLGLTGRQRTRVWRAIVLVHAVCAVALCASAISQIQAWWSIAQCPCAGRGPCCMGTMGLEIAGISSTHWLAWLGGGVGITWAMVTSWRCWLLLRGWRQVRQWVSRARPLDEPRRKQLWNRMTRRLFLAWGKPRQALTIVVSRVRSLDGQANGRLAPIA